MTNRMRDSKHQTLEIPHPSPPDVMQRTSGAMQILHKP